MESTEKTNEVFDKAETPHSHAELKLYSQLSELKCSNYIVRKITIGTKLGVAEVGAIVITPKAIFIVAIDSAKDNVLIDSAGKYFSVERFSVEKSNIVERLGLAGKRIKAELMVNGFDKYINVVSTLYFPYSFFGVKNNYETVKTSYAFGLGHVIDDYEGEDIFSEEDMKQIFEILSKVK